MPEPPQLGYPVCCPYRRMLQFGLPVRAPRLMTRLLHSHQHPGKIYNLRAAMQTSEDDYGHNKDILGPHGTQHRVGDLRSR